MLKCVFCEIVAGRLPSHRVLDDPEFLGFLDQRPVFKGHVLVVPRAHCDNLLDLPASLHAGILGRAQRLARALGPAIGADGTFVALNDRVSQSVPHLHTHVVPRVRKDGLRGFYWPRQRYDGDTTMEAVAARIAASLTPG